MTDGEKIEKLEALIKNCQKDLTDNLVQDISDVECIQRLLGRLDGPEFRATQD